MKGDKEMSVSYHKITRDDCLTVATSEVKAKLDSITNIHILKALAVIWCEMNGYNLGRYISNNCWDATSKHKGG